MVASSQGQTYVNVGIALTILATTAVVARFVARWKKGVPIGADDYCICVAVVLAFGMLAEGVIWARDGGLGKPYMSLTYGEQKIFWKCFLANQFTYTFLIPPIKISVLLFYRRIFKTRQFFIASLVAGSIVAAWCLAVFFTAIFQCKPIAFFWDKKILNGTCIDPQTFFWGNSISNLLTDVIILVIPLHTVWGLQMSMAKKAAVMAIFLLGSFVCVASIMRIVSLGDIKSMDISYSIVKPAMWTQVEPCFGIICACLPTMRPLFSNCFSSFASSYGRDGTGKPDQRQPTDGSAAAITGRGHGRRINITKEYEVLSFDRSRKPESETPSFSDISGRQYDQSTDEYPLTNLPSDR